MTKIKTARTAEGEKFYYLGHTQAVVDDNGNNIEDLLAEQEEKIELLNDNTGVSDYPEFSTSKTYKTGTIVRHEGALFKFTSDHEPGIWDLEEVKSWSINAESQEKLTELVKEVDILDNKSFGMDYSETITIKNSGGEYEKLLLATSNDKKYKIVISNITSNKVLFIYKKINGVRTEIGNTGYRPSASYELNINEDTYFGIQNADATDIDATITITSEGLFDELKTKIETNKSDVIKVQESFFGVDLASRETISGSGGKYIVPINYNLVGSNYDVELTNIDAGKILFYGKVVNGNDILVGNTSYQETFKFSFEVEDGMSEFYIQNQNYTAMNVTINIKSAGIDKIVKDLSKSTKVEKAVIKIKPNGGDFNNFRSATEFIKNNPHSVGYRLEVYEGEYDVFKDFSQSELNAANFANGFGGIDITDGVDVVGVGCRDKIVIKGELNNNTYSQAVREEISTIQLKGNCIIKNLTIKSNYIRYAVHDDFVENIDKEHRIEGCRIVSDFSSNGITKGIAYGIGTRSGIRVYFDSCEISSIGGHNNTGFDKPDYVEVSNSRVGHFGMAESDSGNNGIVNIVNSDFNYIKRGNYLHWQGVGQTIYPILGDTPHRLGNTIAMKNANGIKVGQCVKWHSLDWAEPTNEVSKVFGICIGFDSEGLAIIQKYGYISERLLGETSFTGWGSGVYLGVNGSCYLTTTNSRNEAVAVVECQYDGVYYIRLIN